MNDPPDKDFLDKKTARASAKIRRAEAIRAFPDAGTAVRERLLTELPLPAGAIVAGYWPIGSELDVRPVLRHFADEGHVCALPVVQDRGMPLIFRAWTPDTVLAPGVLGVPEPVEGAPEVRPTVLLVPMLAFDRAGFRLGYGAGFYDRTLDRLRGHGPVLAVGVAYADQEMAAVPRDDHDEPLDWLITERFVLRFDRA
jgi:5-formyltetrahydrofolate cyclo-ligase